MKIGIITIWDINANYGNKLQNYAVIKLLQQKGHDVHTIVYYKNHLRILIKYICNGLTGCRLKGKTFQLRQRRLLKSEKFNRLYLNPDTRSFRKRLSEKKYNAFILGSDQVWNTEFWKSDAKIQLFLMKGIPNYKKIALAPSFGTTELPEQYKKDFKIALNAIPFLSVRETEGAEIIERLIGRKVPVLVDPTLMLNASEWKKISKKPKYMNNSNDYILGYFLGTVPGEKIKLIKEKCNLPIYYLSNEECSALLEVDPCEFIYLISHAKLVLTDSFHACVFSFIFEKPFVVYNRNDHYVEMSGRIQELLKMFYLEQRHEHKVKLENLFDSDYRQGKKVLLDKKTEFDNYLSKALNSLAKHERYR